MLFLIIHQALLRSYREGCIDLGLMEDARKKLQNSPKELRGRYLEELMQHSQGLKDWWSSLSTEAYCRDLDPKKSTFRANVHLALTFFVTQVYLGRPFLFTYNKPATQPHQPLRSKSYNSLSVLRSDCVKAAGDILDLCQLLKDNIGLARASYTEFTSSRAALLALLAHSLTEGSERLSNALSNGMNLMRSMASGLDSAKSDLSVIETLERAISRLDARSRAQLVSNNSRQPSGYQMYKSWAQLLENSPQASDGSVEANQPSVISADAHNMSEFAGVLMDTDLPEYMLDSFFAYPQTMEGSIDFSI